MVNLIRDVLVWDDVQGVTVTFPAGTDSTDIPDPMLSRMRNPALWPGGDTSHIPAGSDLPAGGVTWDNLPGRPEYLLQAIVLDADQTEADIPEGFPAQGLVLRKVAAP